MQQELRISVEDRNASVIRSYVEGCVILKAYPRQLISIRVDIERDEGSALNVALNCCSLALLDSGIELFLTPCCMSFAIFPSHDDLLVDPIASEESVATSTLLCSFGQTNELLLCEAEGPLDEEQLELALGLAARATGVLREFMRTVIAKSTSLVLTTQAVSGAETEEESMAN